MGQELGHGGADAVVQRGGRQFARLDGARADRLLQAQAEHLVAIALGAALVPNGLRGGEGQRDSLPGRVESEPAGQDLGDQFGQVSHERATRGCAE